MHYWPFAWEYSIWNTAVAALQFWTAYLEPHILSNVIERVYTAFFHSNSAQQLQNLPEEILFSCFVTTLNDTFEKELAQDEGYESGNESLNIPTLLKEHHKYTTSQWVRIYLSILPHHLPQLNNTQYTHPKDSEATVLYTAIWCLAVLMKRALWDPVTYIHLWHSSSSDSNPFHGRAEPPSPVQHYMNYHHTCTPSTDDFFHDATAEGDFPTAQIDDTICLEDPVPDRHLCIHEESQLHYQNSYPYPYRLDLPHPLQKMQQDLSDISDIQNVMTTTSDDNLSDLEDIFGMYMWTMVCINIYTLWTLPNELMQNCT